MSSQYPCSMPLELIEVIAHRQAQQVSLAQELCQVLCGGSKPISAIMSADLGWWSPASLRVLSLLSF